MTMRGGEKMKAFLTKLSKDLTSGKPMVRVGFLSGSMSGEHHDQPSPTIAFILENGAPAAHIPPRPFFRNMIVRRSGKWGAQLAAFLRSNNYNVKMSLDGMGLIMGEQLQVEITEFTNPGNAPATIAHKGFDKPLEDSKNMKRSVSHEVVLSGGE